MSWSEDFDPTELTVHQIAAVKKTRELFKRLANDLDIELPSDSKAGRYKAMVKTKLEEAAMLANKCISRTQEW